MRLGYPSYLSQTPVTVVSTDGIDSNGVPIPVTTFEGKCRLVESAKSVYQPNGQRVWVNATIYIEGDIATTSPMITGTATVNSRVYKIFRGTRHRNPDGSVNHTKLEVM